MVGQQDDDDRPDVRKGDVAEPLGDAGTVDAGGIVEILSIMVRAAMSRIAANGNWVQTKATATEERASCGSVSQGM